MTDLKSISGEHVVPRWQGYLMAVLSVAVLTAAALPLRSHFLPANLIMVYLLVVTLIARSYQRGAAILASLLSVAAFDFFFIQPHLTFAVEDVQYLLTFAVMLLVGITIGGLTGRLKQTASAALSRERRTASLYRFSRELAGASSREEIERLAREQLNEQLAAARPGSPSDPALSQTIASLAALALEREAQVEARLSAQAEVENEQLRNSLLSSISHDLRTPLASISGSAGTLLTLPPSALADSGQSLLTTIRDESDRLALMVNNILDMTRLESGKVQLRLEWLPLEESIGAALTTLESSAGGRTIKILLPSELPLVKADSVLLERLFANLIDNALRYSSAETQVEIRAQPAPGHLLVTVADRGPGLPVDQVLLFQKFAHGLRPGTVSRQSEGAGLGLSICRAIVAAHGGTISASNRPGGGAEFSFTLPLTEQPPIVPPEPAQLFAASGGNRGG